MSVESPGEWGWTVRIQWKNKNTYTANFTASINWVQRSSSSGDATTLKLLGDGRVRSAQHNAFAKQQSAVLMDSLRSVLNRTISERGVGVEVPTLVNAHVWPYSVNHDSNDGGPVGKRDDSMVTEEEETAAALLDPKTIILTCCFLVLLYFVFAARQRKFKYSHVGGDEPQKTIELV